MVPIGADTLIYGSADAGKTILTAEGSPLLASIQRLVCLLWLLVCVCVFVCVCVCSQLVHNRMAAELHLAEHRVQDAHGAVKTICLSTDIEVHRSLEGCSFAFVIDTARLLVRATLCRCKL
jgi:hypothetical protein